MPDYLLGGFVDELLKIAFQGTNPIPPKPRVPGANADRMGTGIKSPTMPKPMSPARPLGPIPPMNAPRFGAPPGLRMPRLPRTALTLPRGPARVPRNPLKWQRPGSQR